ncbi:MAG: hypothetical protein ACD_6C00016G0001, partial [uncultured bacterium]
TRIQTPRRKGQRSKAGTFDFVAFSVLPYLTN